MMTADRATLAASILLAVLASVPAVSRAQESAQTAAPSARSFDLPAYIAELDRWSAALASLDGQTDAVATLRPTLVPTWYVATEGQRFEISTRWLDEALQQLQSDPNQRDAIRRSTQARLAVMREQAAALAAQPGSPPLDGAAAKLDDILSRQEFGPAREPTAWERFQMMVQEWIFRILGWLLRPLAGSRWTGRVLLWLAIIAAFVMAVLAVRRIWLREPQEIAFDPGGLPAPGERWLSFRAKAAAAAARGDYLDAVRCAYWAGILWLGETGVWQVDLARTPREYLRLLPPGHVRGAPLLALTRRFEDVWYRRQAGSRDDFQDAMTNLEGLGCPLAAASTTEKS